MGENTVVVTDHDFDDLSIERNVLGDIATVRTLTSDVGEECSPEEAASILTEANAVLNLRHELDRDMINNLDDCRVIARYGIGVDNVDLEAATEREIPVTNVPDYCTEEVATHALALSLALIRGIKPYDKSVNSGYWDRSEGPCLHRLSTETVGIVGFGAIGRAVGDRFAAFGADVLASDPYLTETDLADSVAELVQFEELVARSDIVSIHMPLTDETRGMFDAETFDQMPDSAYLVNVARGPIIDTDDLSNTLDAGGLAGAGLDVFPEEPPGSDESLCDHPRVLTTPHVAWYSEEANEERRRKAAQIVQAALEGKPIDNVVNDADP